MKTKYLLAIYTIIFGGFLFSAVFGQVPGTPVKKPVITTLGKTSDLRPAISNMGIAIKSQGSRNTCSVFAVTFLLEYLTAKNNGTKGIDFSEEYLNVVTNKAKGTNDDGDFFENIAQGYKTYGIVNESLLPYQNAFDQNFIPSGALLQTGTQNRFLNLSMIRGNDGSWGLTDAHIDSMIKSLDAGIPVSGGFKVTGESNLEVREFGGIKMWYLLKNPESFGGHSMPIVGYRSSPLIPGGGYFIVRNSGGADWGDKGYGYVSFEYARRYVADVIVAHTKFPFAGMLLRQPMLIKRSIVPRPSPEILTSAGNIFRN
jgi:hypothetical protein